MDSSDSLHSKELLPELTLPLIKVNTDRLLSVMLGIPRWTQRASNAQTSPRSPVNRMLSFLLANRVLFIHPFKLERCMGTSAFILAQETHVVHQQLEVLINSSPSPYRVSHNQAEEAR